MKSDRKRQRYATVIKAEAVRLFVEGERSAAAVARDLGVRWGDLSLAAFKSCCCFRALRSFALSR